jgi:predicted kinase
VAPGTEDGSFVQVHCGIIPGVELRVVVSGAPGTGKTTVAELLAHQFKVPILSLDAIKEALGDSLGLGDESWSDRIGDAAAEVLLRLAASTPGVVCEGWWRRERRERALREFGGWTEVFCRCEPEIAAERVRVRATGARHPIHRDVINPALLDSIARLVATTTPLQLAGGRLVEVDTTEPVDGPATAAAIRAIVGT